MPIWDAFLTAEDHAALGGGRQPWGWGRRPAVLVVDVYRAVFGDEPIPLPQAADAWPNACGLAAWQALPHIARVLQVARSSGVPVVHVGHLRDRAAPSWAPRRLHGSAQLPEDYLARRYDFMPETAPVPGEVVIGKLAPSAFFGTPLIACLNQWGIDTLVVVGETTSGCVRASVVDARSYRLRVLVPEECVFDRHQAPHAINLFDMHMKYADVIGVEDACAHLARPGESAGSDGSA